MNNILVASPDRLTQAHHLRCVLQHFQDNCLVHNKAKCEFFRSEVEFLGLKVTAGGVAPIPEQLAAVRDFPQPGTVKELQAFLGAVKFCRHFIPARRRISYPSPLSSRATKKGPTSGMAGPHASTTSRWPSCFQSAWLSPRTPQRSPWPPTPRPLMWEPYFSRERGQIKIGGPLGSSRPSWRRPNFCTVPLIGSCTEFLQ